MPTFWKVVSFAVALCGTGVGAGEAAQPADPSTELRTGSGQVDPAAAYAARPIRIVIPSTPGGGNDFLGRLIAPKLTESWRQRVVADNRPGAGGIIGSEIVARAAPDGHTLLIVAKLQAEIAKILHAPDTRSRLANFGFEPVGSTPLEFAAFIRSEMEKWSKLIKDAGIKPE